MRARIQYIRIDWLGNATGGTKRGSLICGPVDDEFIVNFDGTPQRFKADEVRIQLVKRGPFVLGTEVLS